MVKIGGIYLSLHPVAAPDEPALYTVDRHLTRISWETDPDSALGR